MRPLLTLSARWALRSVALILSVALLGGFVRLLPWLLARDVPLGVSLPFAELLARRGVEMAVLLGVPMGTAIASALFVERGEARALEALGARPLSVSAGLLPLGLFTVLAASALGHSGDAEGPGRLATRIVAAGRDACADGSRSHRVDVPMLSLTWLCFAGGPRLVGAVPGLRAGAWFTGSRLAAVDEGSAFVIDDLRLVAGLPPFHLSLHANEARVSSSAGLGHARRLNGAARGLTTGIIAFMTAWSSAWAILRGGLAHPIWAAAASGAAALAAVAAIRALDDRQADGAQYALILPLGAAAAALLHLVAAWVFRSRIAGRKA
jgi:hypothetical protein